MFAQNSRVRGGRCKFRMTTVELSSKGQTNLESIGTDKHAMSESSIVDRVPTSSSLFAGAGIAFRSVTL